ncbi:unnamed protein product [Vitrella brassicaformis CCMP3155]|uniref:Uncharacterized protein n=1 Tax=Vitrella brassicaformis (strain CCMP3155) TaxID=1169540 RepID=A0A0G4F2R6_VITBC|nr:unnamed protein product [Vitrella brassicaformis CCMP3155]|eukprot:CEM05684.1 unnamed protein product [Vitrella brassicaformis CCMP3155]
MSPAEQLGRIMVCPRRVSLVAMMDGNVVLRPIEQFCPLKHELDEAMGPMQASQASAPCFIVFPYYVCRTNEHKGAKVDGEVSRTMSLSAESRAYPVTFTEQLRPM